MIQPSLTQRVMRSVLFVSLLASTAFASAFAKEDAAPVLQDIHKIRIQTYLAINAYYNFGANEGDKALLEDVNSAVNEVNELLNTVGSYGSSAEIEEPLTAVQETWQSYKKILNTNINDILEVGYPDLRLVDDLARTNIELNDQLSALYSQIKDLSQYDPARLTEQSRTSSLTIALMMTKYSARSTSNVSQIFQGAENEQTIDALADEFDRSLKMLSTSQKNTGEIKDLLSSVQTKWEFIRGSYVNYDENNVTYVVNLYSQRIIDSLEEAATLYSDV